ncbi:MAG: type I 3-dehydroquinate dehydratase [Treponema sp.]|jgi:3-dehydroquinate dehydratase/shikimate dehydrogenase|nr:type I 3-dehydroquinate dehydratase [Treponema sp.]
MAKICLCLTASTIGRDLAILEKNRPYIDMVELRVDCLEPNERFLIRRFPEQAGIPVVLTIRRDLEGGNFSEGEGSRIRLLSQGLAFAEADRRKNFAYIDLEEDLEVPSLEEAARTFGTRIIRSSHNCRGIDADIPGKLRKLRRVGDELVKIAVLARGSADALALVRAVKEERGVDKSILCMGPYGIFTRILAEKLDSQIVYTNPEEDGRPRAAPDSLCPRDLVDLYRFRCIRADTKVFAVVGYPLAPTRFPKFFNTVFTLENTNAVCIPFAADSFEDFMALAAELNLNGVSVSVPYKEKAIHYLGSLSDEAERIGACNTITWGPQGWRGVNTDIQGFSDSLLNFISAHAKEGGGIRIFGMGKRGPKAVASLRGKRVTLVGAGGAARAAAAELYRLRAKVLVLNRTLVKARNLALPYKFRWGALDERGINQMEKFSDIIIQTTSLGMAGNTGQDPLELYSFTGKEKVMDLVYEPEQTPLLRRAAAAGCAVLNGYDMLIRQVRYQYAHFLQRDFPLVLFSRVALDLFNNPAGVQ